MVPMAGELMLLSLMERKLLQFENAEALRVTVNGAFQLP
jgi:hypothetical protein